MHLTLIKTMTLHCWIFLLFKNTLCSLCAAFWMNMKSWRMTHSINQSIAEWNIQSLFKSVSCAFAFLTLPTTLHHKSCTTEKRSTFVRWTSCHGSLALHWRAGWLAREQAPRPQQWAVSHPLYLICLSLSPPPVSSAGSFWWIETWHLQNKSMEIWWDEIWDRRGGSTVCSPRVGNCRSRLITT